ncbi:recombinase family protein [Alkalihalobacterium elongatum]|uniref:recombinase family protein n=1 Tax=Alkalihalobacterium elongatum TaxID=2675466 RepID=UPI001C1F48C1|nr:recombinase family protein [Alkalihalobacterium elongatum]
MRCAAYIRVSTDKEEQKPSIQNQKNLFVNYIKEQSWTIHDFYIDIESGTTAKRDNLQKLIEDAKKRKFDVIIAKELSRLARNGSLYQRFFKSYISLLHTPHVQYVATHGVLLCFTH